MKLAIVIQGPSIYVQEVKNAWNKFKDDIIFSTWKGSENLYDENDRVIFNEMPEYEGAYNFNLQKISTYYGLLEAKKLGYTHVIKVRSDYIPTNAENFISILDLDKINLLGWHYTTFLWNSFPTLKGYFSDHLIVGPIDYMIELWDMKDNFVSAQVMVTWSYIKKLSHKVKMKYFLNDLNENNDLIYLKSNGTSYYFFNEIEVYGKVYTGRYESVFQNFRRNLSTGLSEYGFSVEKTEEYFNDNYLNFMKYYNPLPRITIYQNVELTIPIYKIIYPLEKIELVNNRDNITGQYIINASDVLDNETIIIEYFKAIDKIYDVIDNRAGNFKESGYKKGTETNISEVLLTREKYLSKNH